MMDSLKDLIVQILFLLGEDPNRDDLRKTPERVEETLRFLTKGYHTEVGQILKDALFPIEYEEMIVLRDIDFFSLCEHHLLPFFGKCQVAYIPNKKVIGLSKIPRLVELFSRRLQVQERLTCQIAEAINAAVKPYGVAVVMEAQHLCMMMRGVEQQHTKVMTSSMLGVFQESSKSRAEFLELIGKRP